MQSPSVTILHVPYQTRGGEDVHVEFLCSAYRQLGWSVSLLPMDRKPARLNFFRALGSLFFRTPLPPLAQALANSNPNLLHLHNIFPEYGPSLLRFLLRKKIPVAMTMHNHRFYCTNGLALRLNQTCKLCAYSPLPWRALLYNCNQSWTRSIYYALAIGMIRLNNLWDRCARKFIVASPYMKAELMRFGISESKIAEILFPPGMESENLATPANFDYDIVYAGRLSPEKGIHVLLQTIRAAPDLRFAIIGDGALAPEIIAAKLNNLSFLTGKTHSETLDIIRRSRIGVLPSICNESLSLFAMEVFYLGKRCVIADNESTRWLGKDFPGTLAASGNAQDLLRALRETLKMPAIEPQALAIIRDRLSTAKFCEGIDKVLREII